MNKEFTNEKCPNCGTKTFIDENKREWCDKDDKGCGCRIGSFLFDGKRTRIAISKHFDTVIRYENLFPEPEITIQPNQDVFYDLMQKELDTRDKRYMFLKILFPKVLPIINIEGSTNNAVYEIIHYFRKNGEESLKEFQDTVIKYFS